MLLSNITKSDNIANKVLKLTGKPVEGLTISTSAVGQLADIFLKGTDKGYNPQCNYDHLASVFATLAAVCSPCDCKLRQSAQTAVKECIIDKDLELCSYQKDALNCSPRTTLGFPLSQRLCASLNIQA